MELLEQFIEESFKDLPKGLKTHISTVVEIARELAETHSADASEVYLASKGHDICRLTPPEVLLELATEFSVPISDVDREIPMLLHGPVGANILAQHMDLFNHSIYDLSLIHI